MSSKQLAWDDIEQLGRGLYGLSEDWVLRAVDRMDSRVMQIKFCKRGRHGSLLRGKGNTIIGYIQNGKG